MILKFDRVTPNLVTDLAPDEVFVFGSNLGGRHGKGAAKLAREKFGAQPGVGRGWTGRCYAIPTKSAALKPLPLDQISQYVAEFLAVARDNLPLDFKVTAIGCGLAGYEAWQIAPMFVRRGAHMMFNIWLPKEFEVLSEPEDFA